MRREPEGGRQRRRAGLAREASAPGARPWAQVAALALWTGAFALATWLWAPDASEGPDLLPATALAWLAPNVVEGRVIEEGVVYTMVLSPRGPWTIHLVSAELDRCHLGLVVAPAASQDGGRVRTLTTEMAPDGHGAVLAGVNGDFFRLDNGAPLGPEVTETTRRLSTRPALAWSRGSEPWIGLPVWDGDRMSFGPDAPAETPRDSPAGASPDALGETPPTARAETPPGASGAPGHLQVIGGYPELLDHGELVGDLGVGERPEFADARHPRTAVGYDSRKGLLWMVVVDGRQRPRSAGMKLGELADLLKELGVDEALNLDGGGSSAMVLDGGIANNPSDQEGERPVANSLWLVSDPEACAPS